jgi:hypothetical protein
VANGSGERKECWWGNPKLTFQNHRRHELKPFSYTLTESLYRPSCLFLDSRPEKSPEFFAVGYYVLLKDGRRIL